MIAKILKKSTDFGAVRYSTDKVMKDTGELLLAKNFGILQALQGLRPSDYINYLEALTSKSQRIIYPQFHAVISCEGKTHDKHELTNIGELWMKEMGYGNQPYIFIFHKDTENNHIHIVSTRIGRDGKRINPSMERLKSLEIINRITKKDHKLLAQQDVEKALQYSFSTRAQFMMVLESKGYEVKLVENEYLIFKDGVQLTQVPLQNVDNQVSNRGLNPNQIRQLWVIIQKYRSEYDPSLYQRTIVDGEHILNKKQFYSSKLADLLHHKFGIVVMFHSKDGKMPYGYTLIDHAKGAVYKGGEIMPLHEFIQPSSIQEVNNSGIISPEINERQDQIIPTSSLQHDDDAFSNVSHPTIGSDFSDDSKSNVFLPEFQFDIAEDIDDEAILGRNRRRKRKARTNTR